MTSPLDDQYLEWLYRQVASIRLKNPTRTYWSLIRQLYAKEFVWLVPNDDNRVEDGRDLRYEFMDHIRGLETDQVDPEWLGLGCSVLEMLMGLSRRLAFEDGGEARDWFWALLENLDLHDCTDYVYRSLDVVDIEESLDDLIWRTYEDNGRGGLFPLRHPEEDQRDVELWYQMSAYLLERD